MLLGDYCNSLDHTHYNFYRTPYIFSNISEIIKSGLFLLAGLIIFSKTQKKEITGKRIAGISFVLWSFYNLIYGFLQTEFLMDLIFGILAGFQVLSSFGWWLWSRTEFVLRQKKRKKRSFNWKNYCRYALIARKSGIRRINGRT